MKNSKKKGYKITSPLCLGDQSIVKSSEAGLETLHAMQAHHFQR